MTTKTCTHFWMIEPANGKYSNGVCRHCGEIRVFENYILILEQWEKMTLS